MCDGVIMINPTVNSNWLINNFLLCGGFPTDENAINEIIQCGINVFICLVPSSEIKKRNLKEYHHYLSKKGVEFYKFPIIDQNIASDSDVFVWCNVFLDLLYRGKCIYFHCYGGHGRVGTLSACLLQFINVNLKADECIDIIEHLHSTRLKGYDQPSPSTNEQYMQIKRFRSFTTTILVCGDRNWKNENAIYRELQRFPKNATIIQGGCKGADEVAKNVCRKLKLKCIEVNAEWNKYGKKAGPIRNEKMLKEYSPLVVLAFHSNIEKSKGTKNMLKRAHAHDIFTRIIIN